MDVFIKISSLIKYKTIGIVVVSKRKMGYDISYYQMQKKGSSVDICFSQEGLSSFEKIADLSEKKPTILCVQGIGLVQRMMTGSYADIKQNIPNINTDEYLVELDETNPDEKLVVLCRKELVESILAEESIQRIPVHGVSLGFTGVSRYLQLFSSDIDHFGFEGNSILLGENRVLEIRRRVAEDIDDYTFADKKRKASEILALATGLTYFTENNWNTFQLPGLIEKVKEYTASKLTGFILYYLGAAMFILLLINFLMFDHYNTRRNQLEIESQGISTLQNEINSLQADLGTKRQFIRQNNVPENFAFAFYADRLANFVSAGISFSEISVCPLTNKVKEDKMIGFYSNKLRVTGTASNSTIFSTFLEKINTAKWVKALEKQVYNYNLENDNADFELEILLNDAID